MLGILRLNPLIILGVSDLKFGELKFIVNHCYCCLRCYSDIIFFGKVLIIMELLLLATNICGRENQNLARSPYRYIYKAKLLKREKYGGF